VDDGSCNYIVFIPSTKSELQTAVDLWKSDNEAALATYNNISNWDVSLITDMSNLFEDYAHSDIGDLSSWDVSSVTDMSYMFNYAYNFTSDLSNWDVSSVTNMTYMFSDCNSFNEDLSSWDMSNVTDISYMFYHADNFNQPLTGWDVSSVTNFGFHNMFWYVPGISDENKCAIYKTFSMNDNFVNCGSCGSDWGYLCPIEGCMDEPACNYYPDAEVDDGSCYYECDDCAGVHNNSYHHPPQHLDNNYRRAHPCNLL
jgi:surface protein